ncbi:MAG: hypothetical protein EAZ99_16910 [Alphaproteobacteria bacterium]|nr:MAG: hypothetical protein EAZ99_16910 [Alphaproteobacteria bacterium]
MKVFDRQGRQVPLGRKLGSGGEGAVFAVNDHRKLAAKVYHKGIDPEKAEKLARMSIDATPALLDLAAWPVDVLYSDPGGKPIGLLMPRIEGFKSVHLLYGPKSRRQEFPDAQWPFLVHTATNVARAFAAIHSHDHVVGDVNHGNLLVDPRGIVRFIDCDSFQIKSGGRHYLCEVGIATHTPPELQGISFRGLVRTANHDAFGLAVMIFQTLMMGRHPFSGGFTGRGEMPLEQAISERRFAYGSGASARSMKQPPGTLALEALGPAAALFEQAFIGSGARPTANQWGAALGSLTAALAQCRDNPSHHFYNSLSSCPWCRIEKQSGISFFQITAANLGKLAADIDIDAIWARIKAIRPPDLVAVPDPSRFSFKPNPRLAAARRAASARSFLGWAIAGGSLVGAMAAGEQGGIAIAVIGCLVALAIARSGSDEAQQLARAEHYQAREAYTALKTRYLNTASPDGFQARLTELERRKAEYDRTADLRLRRLNQLERDRPKQQLEVFLDRFRIEAQSIPGIGDGRKATLASYGIETAADVLKDDILQVPGFGPVLANKLLDWRRSLEANFVFDASKGVDPAAVAKVEADVLNMRKQIESDIRRGEADLRAIIFQVEATRATLLSQLEQAAKRLAQAEADVKAASG